MSTSTSSNSILTRVRLLLVLWFAVILCGGLVIHFFHLRPSRQPEPSVLGEADPIVDIWINKMLGFFLVFLPDNTVRLYDSYSFELNCIGQWRKVEDRAIYPESPKVGLPSYQVEFENGRMMDIFLYAIAHHDSIAVEARDTGHRGYNRLNDVDDPTRFYYQKFKRGLFQELSIVDSYWKAHQGRPSH